MDDQLAQRLWIESSQVHESDTGPDRTRRNSIGAENQTISDRNLISESVTDPTVEFRWTSNDIRLPELARYFPPVA